MNRAAIFENENHQRNNQISDLLTSQPARGRSVLFARLSEEAQKHKKIKYGELFEILGPILRVDKAGARELLRLFDMLGIIEDNRRGFVYLHRISPAGVRQ